MPPCSGVAKGGAGWNRSCTQKSDRYTLIEQTVKHSIKAVRCPAQRYKPSYSTATIQKKISYTSLRIPEISCIIYNECTRIRQSIILTTLETVVFNHLKCNSSTLTGGVTALLNYTCCTPNKPAKLIDSFCNVYRFKSPYAT